MAGERPGDFGAKLRDARERKGVSLREIANRTKISVAVLEALERNEIARLPGGIFSRAFVRAYASEVGLDPETTIQDFVAQFPHDSVVAGHSSSDPIEDNVALESERRVASTVLWMFLICVPLAGVVLYLSTVNRAIPIDTAPAPAATTPASASPAAAPASDMKPPDVKPPAAPASAPSVPPVEATAGSTPPRAAAPTASESTVPAPTAMTAPSKPAPAPADASPAADRLVVGFAARRPVYVSVTADGRTVISRLLQPGERTRVEIVRDLTLTAGDASALSMTLNGAEARALGKAGEVVTTRVTLANFKDYLQTR